MRILVGGIAHETNTFNPMPTSIESFKVIRGRELSNEEPAISLLSIGVDVVPTLYAVTLPSGLVDGDAYSILKNEFVEEVKGAVGVDGVCLLLHGAMVVKGVGSAELDMVRTIREVLGEEVIISASLDLHGNLPAEIVKYADILTAYRTTPHVDVANTRRKAAELLVESVKRGKRPKTAIVKPPILFPGEYVVTDTEPAASLYRTLSNIDSTPGILDSSLLVGMAWADVQYAGASVVTVSEEERKLDEAYKKAHEMAMAYWCKRFEFQMEVEAKVPQEAVRQAKSLSETKRPCFISDSGDNVTAGGAGDVPIMLEELVSSEVDDAVMGGMVDEEAVEVCRKAGVGASLRLRIGGKLDKINGYPLEIRGRVMKITENGAVFRIGGVDVIITTKRTAFTSPEEFTAFGIDLSSKKVVVVKLGLLTAELKRIAAQAMIALTPGFTNLLIEQLDYKEVRRPIFPIDRDFDWRC